MSKFLSTSFYVVAEGSYNVGEYGEALQARQGKKGLFAVRTASIDTDPHGAGILHNPFGLVQRFLDRVTGEKDYTLTVEEAQERLDAFSIKNRDAGHRILML